MQVEGACSTCNEAEETFAVTRHVKEAVAEVPEDLSLMFP